MRFPLRVKLILAICLPLLAVYLTVLLLEYRSSKRETLKQVEQYLTKVSAHEALALDQQLSSVAQIARTTERLLETDVPRERAALERLARAHVQAEPQLFGFGIALEAPGDAEPGEHLALYVCRTPDDEQLQSMDITSVAYDYMRSDWYLLPKLLREPAWTDPYFDEGLGRILMCSHAVPLLRNDQFEGVVVADVSLENVRRQVCQTHYRGEYRFLISSTGTFVYHPNEAYVMAESVFSLAEWHGRPELAEVGRAMIAGQEGVVRILDPQTSEPKWCAFASVPAAGWSLAAMIPEQEALAPVRDRLRRQLYVMLAGLGVILASIILLSSWITRPLEHLAAAVRTVAQGQLDVQLEGIRSRDEIGELALTFNQMVTDLKANIEATVRETAAREAIERELQVARQIQTSLLPMLRPPFPHRREFSLHADNEPAKFMAGDFFDFWLLDEQNLVIVIADVSGKGVPAAMFMAVARTTLRNFSTPGCRPREVIETANRLIAADNEETMFVTLFYGHYHIPSGELVYVNAGHNPPALVRRNGRAQLACDSTGTMLGVFPDAEFDEGRLLLEPGDLLLLYTDGVTEACDPQGQFFGEAGLTGLLDRLSRQSVEAICQGVLRDVNAHRRHEGQDDVTLVALRRAEEASRSADASPREPAGHSPGG